MNMMQLFNVGDEIGGYCNGYFGRDDYDNKVCVSVVPKYAVFQSEEGEGSVLRFTKGLVEDVKSDNWRPK